MFLISSSDDFKDNNTIDISKSKKEDNDDNGSPGVSSYNINGETSAGLFEKKDKDFHTLLDQVTHFSLI